MKITKKQLKQIIKEELESVNEISSAGSGKVNFGERLAIEELIKQGKSFFDQVIALSEAADENPSAAERLSMVEQALSREVDEKSHGYVKFTIIG